MPVLRRRQRDCGIQSLPAAASVSVCGGAAGTSALCRTAATLYCLFCRCLLIVLWLFSSKPPGERSNAIASPAGSALSFCGSRRLWSLYSSSSHSWSPTWWLISWQANHESKANPFFLRFFWWRLGPCITSMAGTQHPKDSRLSSVFRRAI